MTTKAARRLHDSTKHGTEPTDRDSLVSYKRLDPSNMPNPFKEYRGLDTIDLPREIVSSSVAAGAVLGGERGERSGLDLGVLSTLLFLSAGVTRVMDRPDRTLYFRTAMSAGNLHPIELYVVAGPGIAGLDAGVYHFSPLDMRLARLRSGDQRGVLDLNARAGLVLTGIPWRTTWKYAERGWRHLYWDAGTLLANTLAVADAHRLSHSLLLGFADDRVTDLVGIDGVEEMPLAILALGENASVASAPPDPISPEVAPLAPSPVQLPLLQEAQSDGELSQGEVEDWRDAGRPAFGMATPDPGALEGLDDPIEKVILRRGSTRRMVREQVPARALDWPMAAATRPVGIDVLGERTLLDHYVNVHAVEGMEPGAFRYEAPGWERLGRSGSLREVSAQLCMGQALGGESAFTVFHCAGLDPILDAFGSRGYRVAQLEAGVVSGRLALCAFAMGLGATGLTFLDDAVSSFFGTPAQPMLVTAVGVPAAGAAPWGSPGDPATLHR